MQQCPVLLRCMIDMLSYESHKWLKCQSHEATWRNHSWFIQSIMNLPYFVNDGVCSCVGLTLAMLPSIAFLECFCKCVASQYKICIWSLMTLPWKNIRWLKICMHWYFCALDIYIVWPAKFPSMCLYYHQVLSQQATADYAIELAISLWSCYWVCEWVKHFTQTVKKFTFVILWISLVS